MYPQMHVTPGNWSNRVMNPHTGRWIHNDNPLKFEASFQRSELAPRYSEKFATEAEGHAWTRKMFLENWTTPARRDEDGEKIPTGRAYFVPFDYGTGHGVSRWSAAKWATVHKLQAAYLKETAQAWKDAAAAPETLAHFAAEKKMPRCEWRGLAFPERLRAALREAGERRDRLVAQVSR